MRMIHKARLVSDAIHAIEKAATDAGRQTRAGGAKKRKMVAAAPAYLKGRVERGEELPSIGVKLVRRSSRL